MAVANDIKILQNARQIIVKNASAMMLTLFSASMPSPTKGGGYNQIMVLRHDLFFQSFSSSFFSY